MIPSTKMQRQLIGIACAQMGIDKETKESMLLERFKKSSTTQISRLQADEFLRELKSRGFETKYNPRKKRQHIPRETDKVKAMVLPQETAKIAALAGLIKWRVENGLALWMEKRLRITKIRTSHDAYRVIEGLKKMFENGMKKQHGPDWWIRIYEDPGIETYIQAHCPDKFRDAAWRARYDAGLIDPDDPEGWTGTKYERLMR